MSNKHKIISCASFGGTGSSAITDLLSEFKCVKGIGDFEFTLLHDVDGILDLKHFLVDDFERLNPSEAIYRFEKLIDKIESKYRPYFGEDFKKEAENYINSIVDVQWKGVWRQHFHRGSKLKTEIKYKLLDRIQIIPLKIYNKFIKKSNYEFSKYRIKDDIKLCYDQEKFMEQTKKYIDRLLSKIDSKNEYKFLMLDQLTTPYNTEKCIEFFSDLKTIVVDRDPRDLYLLNKLYWKEGFIPSHDVKLYVKWFKGIRGNKVSKDSENVLNIKFEDLIYDYENTVRKISDFIGFDKKDHINKLKSFNPEISIKNSRLWEKENRCKEEIEYITNNLSEYCYELKREK